MNIGASVYCKLNDTDSNAIGLLFRDNNSDTINGGITYYGQNGVGSSIIIGFGTSSPWASTSGLLINSNTLAFKNVTIPRATLSGTTLTITL